MPVTRNRLRSEELSAKGFCQGTYGSPSRCVGRITRLRESMSCEDFPLPSNGLGCRSQRTLSFTRAISKRTRRSPHLVSADKVMPKSRLAVGKALDAELTHPMAQGVGMEIQDSRRTLRPMNHSICLLKGGQDMVSLHLFQRRQS
jgi:hypothetical protein